MRNGQIYSIPDYRPKIQLAISIQLLPFDSFLFRLIWCNALVRRAVLHAPEYCPLQRIHVGTHIDARPDQNIHHGQLTLLLSADWPAVSIQELIGVVNAMKEAQLKYTDSIFRTVLYLQMRVLLNTSSCLWFAFFGLYFGIVTSLFRLRYVQLYYLVVSLVIKWIRAWALNSPAWLLCLTRSGFKCLGWALCSVNSHSYLAGEGKFYSINKFSSRDNMFLLVEKMMMMDWCLMPTSTVFHSDHRKNPRGLEPVIYY